MKRRAVLKGLALTVFTGVISGGGVLRAQENAPIVFARLRLRGLPVSRPGAIAQVVREVENNSSVVVDRQVAEVEVGSPQLFNYPFLVLSGDRSFARLTDEEVGNLRLYLREGGFLFIDDSSGLEDSPFDRSVRRAVGRIVPGSALRPVGRDHVVYRSFFLLRGISGRLQVRDYLEGAWIGDITPILYSQNDLLGSLQRSPGGDWALDVVPGGERQRTESRKLAVNLALFALTGNYKLDVVHVETLLDRMRKQGGYGR
jgi:hypothetical protein